ncbi:isochorismate synthase [Schaalia sp. lx-260]|uniref:isochorismate synthase n=1 Tax=Schaalia sp. lx-260 TaxID=2899082 RepID=UPI001E5AFEBC|nr:isochorismate synthase [Schaalia sp. lx-260]MCD4549110.1 isochorismate synthase [Schaalia sp. lx-260]
MATCLTSDFSALHIRVEALPENHPLAHVPLFDLAPHGQQLLAWNGTGHQLLGWGNALSITVDGPHAIRDAARIWDEVRSVAHVDSPTQAPRAPFAFGSFGFASTTPGILRVPEVTIIDHDYQRFIATAALSAPAPDPLTSAEAAAQEKEQNPIHIPSGLRTQPGRMTQNAWAESVRRVIERLRLGSASKVVMARDMRVTSPLPVDERFLLQRLSKLYPTTWVYAVDKLIGATPELLASTRDGTVHSRVLAGSARTHADRLMTDMKERTEHLLAVESVVRALSPLVDSLDVPSEPFLLELPNVTHLATDIHGHLRDSNVLDVVSAVHPTAAVCGSPTPLAFDLLSAYETTERGRYCGPIGWIDAQGEGEFGIALRCAQLSKDGTNLRLFAGAGIMPDSVPEAELAETRAKMSPLLEALGI